MTHLTEDSLNRTSTQAETFTFESDGFVMDEAKNIEDDDENDTSELIR